MNTPLERYGLTRMALDSCPVYLALARLLLVMGFDADHFGTEEWNPLGTILKRGECVVIKPNLVFHEHYKGGRLHGVVTDPRLIRATADLVFRAIGADGRLVIGDAPLQSADWNLLVERTGLADLPDFYAKRGFRCDLRDFRTIESRSHRGLKLESKRRAGDPSGYRAVDLGAASMHREGLWERFRVTNYDPHAMRAHHNQERHEYLVSGSILEASTVINIAKLKTHRKSGLTGPMKNLVGINGCKDWLPHHTKGNKDAGGDEYARPASWKLFSTWLVEHEELSGSDGTKRLWNALRRAVWVAGKSVTSDHTWEGSWHGNDTLWRTILDLNRAALYADREGLLKAASQRRFLVLVDALIAGEGEGPMAPSPVPMGVLLGGRNPAAVELASTRLAGWPVERLPLLAQAFAQHEYPIADFDADGVFVQAFEAGGELAPTDFQQFVRQLKPCSGWVDLLPKTEFPAPEIAHV